MLDCSPFNIVSPYWFLQLNIEWSCSPVWDESTPASTGVWNQVNHRLLSVRRHYPDCQTQERREGWRTGMSQQHQLAEWIVWTCPPTGSEPALVVFRQDTRGMTNSHVSGCAHINTQSLTVHPMKVAQLQFSLSLSLVIFPGAPAPIAAGFSFNNIYLYTQSPEPSQILQALA